MRTLIVEDQPIVAMVLEDMLDGFGLEIVSVCGDVETAMNVLDSHAIELAFLDYNLGDETSEPIALRLLADQRFVIMMSGQQMTNPVLQSLPSIDKPFGLAIIEQKLSEIGVKPA